MLNKKFKPHFGKISIIAIILCVALVAVDLILKHFEEAQKWEFTVIPGFIWVEHGHHNYGSAFSFLADASWGPVFLTAFAAVLLCVLATAFIFIPERFSFLKIAMAMIIAGAVANLVDRVAFGYVRDFVWVNMLFSTACCNFADFFIVFGVIFAVIDFLFLNEWAIIPLTKRAKAAHELEKQRELAEKQKNESPDDLSEDGKGEN